MTNSFSYHETWKTLDIVGENLLTMIWTLCSVIPIKNKEPTLSKACVRNSSSTCTHKVKSKIIFWKNPANVIAVGLITHVMRSFLLLETKRLNLMKNGGQI